MENYAVLDVLFQQDCFTSRSKLVCVRAQIPDGLYVITIIKALNNLLFSNSVLKTLIAHQIPMETEMSMFICNLLRVAVTMNKAVTMTSIFFPLNSCLVIHSMAKI